MVGRLYCMLHGLLPFTGSWTLVHTTWTRPFLEGLSALMQLPVALFPHLIPGICCMCSRWWELRIRMPCCWFLEFTACYVDKASLLAPLMHQILVWIRLHGWMHDRVKKRLTMEWFVRYGRTALRVSGFAASSLHSYSHAGRTSDVPLTCSVNASA